MKILLDTNIIIDFLTAREPFGKEAKDIIALIENKDIDGFLSASSITTIHYLSRKVFNKKRADDIIKDLLDIFEVTDLNRKTFIKAIELKGVDFEDSVIYSSALFNKIDIIISRDSRGFKNSPVITLKPKEFLSFYYTKNRDL